MSQVAARQAAERASRHLPIAELVQIGRGRREITAYHPASTPKPSGHRRPGLRCRYNYLGRIKCTTHTIRQRTLKIWIGWLPWGQMIELLVASAHRGIYLCSQPIMYGNLRGLDESQGSLW